MFADTDICRSKCGMRMCTRARSRLFLPNSPIFTLLLSLKSGDYQAGARTGVGRAWLSALRSVTLSKFLHPFASYLAPEGKLICKLFKISLASDFHSPFSVCDFSSAHLPSFRTPLLFFLFSPLSFVCFSQSFSFSCSSSFCLPTLPLTLLPSFFLRPPF